MDPSHSLLTPGGEGREKEGSHPTDCFALRLSSVPQNTRAVKEELRGPQCSGKVYRKAAGARQWIRANQTPRQGQTMSYAAFRVSKRLGYKKSVTVPARLLALYLCRPGRLDRNTGTQHPRAPYFTVSEPRRHIFPVTLATSSRLLREDASRTAALCSVPRAFAYPPRVPDKDSFKSSQRTSPM